MTNEELIKQNKWLEEQVVTLSRSLADCYRRDFDRFVEYRDRYDKLDRYNSELCMELTITMDKLCLAEKEIERLKGEKLCMH